MKKLLALAICLTAAHLLPAQNQNFDNVEEKILPVQGNVYMLVGAGGNSTLQVGKDGVLVVDTQYAQMAPKIMAAIRTLSPMPIKYIINTHVHGDHTDGNGALVKLGGGGAMPRIIANDHVLNRMSAKPAPGQAAIPDSNWPNDEYFGASKDFFFNNEAVMVYHMPDAHTDGDSIVFFRRSDVVSTGDVFTPEHYPIIDLQRGGSVQGIIDALNRIIEITVPAKYQEGGTYVIPGHGRLCEEADVVEYRDMVTIIRDRIADLLKKGRTLEQVKTAKPTLDYDTQYGATTGIWTTDMFIDAVYKSLTAKK
ncbi:MAG TPA: MBL fold metallo-hydrolase [Bryobacteraceae bacterium]|jgi:glyoxylase-like metal-dependent hydrolase (beta-lactamase superfamily II)|nr:MBL fold metallo-hydrolase [Bryobacteraceae bacterium]